MARQPRLFVPGFPQLLQLQSVPGRVAFELRDHYVQFLSLLDTHARHAGVAVHAYALWPSGGLLLLGTPDALAAGRLMQAINRVFVPQRGQSGPMWVPRFRSTAVQPGLWALRATLWVDEAPVRLGITNDAATYPFCSFAGHTGVVQDRLLTHLPVYVSLGNTPFDRQMAFRQLAEQGIGSSAQQRLQQAVQTGWLVADDVVAKGLQAQVDRPLVPRPRGRPRKTPDAKPLTVDAPQGTSRKRQSTGPRNAD